MQSKQQGNRNQYRYSFHRKEASIAPSEGMGAQEASIAPSEGMGERLKLVVVDLSGGVCEAWVSSTVPGMETSGSNSVGAAS